MCAALVGDLKWLMKACKEDAGAGEYDLRCLSGKEDDLNETVSDSDMVVMLVDQVPHAVRRRVLFVASANNMPVYMHRSNGVSSIRSSVRSMTAGL